MREKHISRDLSEILKKSGPPRKNISNEEQPSSARTKQNEKIINQPTGRQRKRQSRIRIQNFQRNRSTTTSPSTTNKTTYLKKSTKIKINESSNYKEIKQQLIPRWKYFRCTSFRAYQIS